MSETLSTIRTQLSLYLNDVSDNIWSEAQKNHAINAAIRDAYPSWFTEVTSSNGASNWIVVCDEKLEYTLPTMRRLLGVKVEVSGNYFSGNITASTTTGMSDTTASWTADQFINTLDYPYHVAVYAGARAGIYAAITGNSATTLTVETTGYNWAAGAESDGDGKYMIKKVSEQIRDWRAITAYRTDTFENPSTLYLTANYISGMYLQLHYLTVPAELDSDTDTTDVPMQWLIYEAAANLQVQRMRGEPGFENRTTTDLFTIDKNLADSFREKHAMRFPADTIRTEKEHGFVTVPDEYPF